jgi:hypothetical protein
MKTVVRPPLQRIWASPVGEGFQLELTATLKGLVHQVVTIVADEKDESLWAQIESGDYLVQIPASVLQDVLNDAVGQVHSEVWYDRQLPPESEA